MTNDIKPNPYLFGEIRQLIDSARQRAAAAVNAELSLLYWQVGCRIHREVLDEKRAQYGKDRCTTLPGAAIITCK